MKKIVITFPVLAGIMWGATGVFARFLKEYGMNNATLLETRMILGAIILFAGCMVIDKSLLKIKKEDIFVFLAGGLLGNFGLSYFYTEATHQLSLSFAAVLLCTFPVFVILMSAVLFKEKITLRKVGCMAFAFAGCVLVSGVLEDENAKSWTVYGVFIGILAAFCYALYSIFSKMARERGYSPITITFYFMLLVSVILAPFTDWTQIGSYVIEAPAAHIAFLLGHCLCAAVLPYVIYTYSMSFMDAGKASILASSEPLAAMVLGALIFNEVPTALMIGGMLITIVALTILSLPEKE